MQKQNQFQKFNKLLTPLLEIPHSEIKAKLEAEKEAKKRKKSKKSSASREGV